MREAASIGKPVLPADSAAVGAALAELPAGTLVAQCAVGLTEIALAETLLNLSNGRALAEIPSSALEPMCHVRVIGAKTAAKAGIVRPPVSVPNACTIEIISVDEVIVYEDVVVSPSSVPSPVVPAPTPNRTKGKSSSP
jgi:hypothetical protein